MKGLTEMDKQKYLEENNLIEITKLDGKKPANLNVAKSMSQKQYGHNEVEFIEEIDAFVVKTKSKESEYKSKSIHTPKNEEANPRDAIKRLEDTGTPMASFEEAKDYNNERMLEAMRVERQACEQESQRLRLERAALEQVIGDARMKQAMAEQEKIKSENRYHEITRREDQLFRESIEKSPKVNMSIKRRRNRDTVSLELKTTKFDPKTGALVLGKDNKPIMTEYLLVIINGKRFGPAHLLKVDYNVPTFDLGQDTGLMEGFLMLTDVPWAAACALVEKRPMDTPTITNPMTGKTYRPPRRDTNTPSAPLIDVNGSLNWQHQIAF